MRTDPRIPQPPLFSRRDSFRLMSMLMLLVVISMLIYRTRDPAMWRWLADDLTDENTTRSQQTAVRDGEAVANPDRAHAATGSSGDSAVTIPAREYETLRSGPNELQPFEQSQAQHQFQAVTDKTPIAAEEMPAYWRLMRWSMTESFDEQWARAKKDRYFTHFAQDPEKHRGELIAMKVSLRRSSAHDPVTNSAGAEQVYEAWGVTPESRTGLYCLLFYDQPPELPIAYNIHEEGLFVGYFLKLMAYEDAMGVSRWTPVLIGRLRWQENVTRSALRQRREDQANWPWYLAGAVVFLAVIGFGTKLYLQSGQSEMQAAAAPDHSAIERWLEAGSPTNEPLTFDEALLAEPQGEPVSVENRPDALANLSAVFESEAVPKRDRE